MSDSDCLARQRLRHGAAAATLVACALAGTAVPPAAGAQSETPGVSYTIDLSRAAQQLVDVVFEVSGLSAASFEARFPAWRPGRYVILDPVGAIEALSATASVPVTTERVGKAGWRIENGAGEPLGRLRIQYRLYANALGLRTLHADDSHAFLSGSAVFLYSEPLRHLGARVQITGQPSWRVATGLEPAGDDPFTLHAPSYDVLVDSPIEVGEHELLTFQAGGKLHEIAIWPPGSRYDEERIVADFRAIVEAQGEIFGNYPYERYVFLLHASARARGGTEHLNSTIMQTSRDALEGSLHNTESYRGLLGLTSHEMFHTWNVKQLRPAGLTPYDYDNENHSTLFWVAEGTTSYYDDLTLVRTGLLTEKQYFTALSKSITSLRERPGARVQSLSSSSWDAWTKFNRRTPNDVNSTVSFYSKGALASLVLDTEIRAASGDRKSLDDVLRDLYERHPLQSGGFTRDDLESAVERAAGRRLDTFFADSIDGTRELPLEESLGHYGLELARVGKKIKGLEPMDSAADAKADDESEVGESSIVDRVWTGLDLADEPGRTRIRAVLTGGPAHEAGLLAGDVLVAFDGRTLEASELDQRLLSYRDGETVTVHVVRGDLLLARDMTLVVRPFARWQVRRRDDATDVQKQRYEDWLGLAWPHNEPSADTD